MTALPRGARGRLLPKEETGRVYGKLTVLRMAPQKLTKDGRPDPNVIWICQCECGNTSLVRGQCLRSGNSKSCGCVRREKWKNTITKPAGVAAHNKAIGIMLRNAKNRGLDWNITIEKAQSLMAKDCHYCGSPPSNLCKSNTGELLYSGIDRIDNSLGYFEGNVVPCCQKCNTAKSDMTLSEFRDWGARLQKTFIRGEF